MVLSPFFRADLGERSEVEGEFCRAASRVSPRAVAIYRLIPPIPRGTIYHEATVDPPWDALKQKSHGGATESTSKLRNVAGPRERRSGEARDPGALPRFRHGVGPHDEVQARGPGWRAARGVS